LAGGNMFGIALTIAVLAFVIGTAAFIITKSKLFENLRNRVTHPFFKKLINCPYCLSFWLTALGIIFYFFEVLIIFVFFLFVVGGLGGMFGIILTWLCKKAGL